MPTPDDRIAHALTAIEFVAGEDERRLVESKLTQQNRQTFGGDLHIGGFRGGIGLFKSNAETLRRNLVRAILLAELAQGTLQSPQVGTERTDLLALNAGQLEDKLRKLFPYKAFAGRFAKRSEWDPRFFTNPWNHNDTQYMYVSHSIMRDASQVGEIMKQGATQSDLETFNELRAKYIGYARVDGRNPLKKVVWVDFCKQYLDNPNILKQNIISCSVIDENKHSTYYPFGFILRVPPECVYVTSPTDVAVANRTDDILAELQRVNVRQQSKIRAPRKILANTRGTSGDTGYNEIVVVGTSPEGRQVDVIGLFVKTDGQGNLFIRNRGGRADATGVYANAELQSLISKCAKQFRLPIVPISDTSSAQSNTAWPFGSLHGTNDLQLPQRARSSSFGAQTPSLPAQRRGSLSL
jgi:hypothetical protein